MKKQLITAALTVLSFGVVAQQSLDDKLREETCKANKAAIASAVKNTENAKRALKGSTWQKLGDAYLEDAISCGKDSTVSLKAYDMYKKALDVDAAAGGKEKKAIEAAMKDAKLTSAIMSQGAALYNGKNLKQALTMFKLVNDLNPADTTAALYAGIVAQQSQDLATAKKYFQNFVANKGKDAAVYYSLALIARNDKDFDGAIDILKKGMAVNPSDKDLKGELINTYIAANKLDEATADLQKLVDADPSNVANLTNLAILYDNSKQLDKAMEYYKKALALQPNNFDVNFNIAALHFNEGVEIKNKVDKMDIKTYQKEGKAIESLVCEKFKLAKPYFEKCLEIRPADEDVKTQLSSINNILSQCK